MTVHRVLQTNLNHSVAAQDLLCQHVAEWSIDLVVAAEPYSIPQGRTLWAGDKCGSVMIMSSGRPGSPPFTSITKGEGFVAATWGEVLVVGIYVSPNVSLIHLERLLDEVENVIRRHLPCPVLIAGDPNAKSTAWGSSTTNARGEALEEWAEELGLLVLNRGRALTCVRGDGGSVIDITLGCPRASLMVSGWQVLGGEETLSDHKYVMFRVSDPSLGAAPILKPARGGNRPSFGWVLRKMDRDLLMAAAIAKSFTGEMTHPVEEADRGAEQLRGMLTDLCDVSMPRRKTAPLKRCVYWWSSELAELRSECNRARRRYTHCRRRRDGVQAAAPLQEAYRVAKKALQRAISAAKARAWTELIDSIDGDPWGRPYKIVRKKLSAGGPPITETLDPRVLEEVVSTLFPGDAGNIQNIFPPPENNCVPWDQSLGVTEDELGQVIRRLRAKKTAPGPDGIPARVVALTAEITAGRLRQLFDRCLETGRFPRIWKQARMVLIPKEGKPAGTPSAYRPICLLDEAGKLFERILAARLREHLSRNGPDLAKCQYGFREGLSTIDAIMRVRTLSEEAIAAGRVVLAVSLDIANAFNTLPWECVRGALRYHRVPAYLQEVVADYFRDRKIVYPGRYGKQIEREAHRGVPQGSVLGPLLWNLGYDWVLRGALLPGQALVCYADDTLVLSWGIDWSSTIRLAEAGVGHVVGRIKRLGLEVAPQKTEAIWFAASGKRGPPRDRAQMEVEGVRVEIGTQMRYLGLILDSRWSFGPHMAKMAPRVRAIAASLGRLMPNLGGPGDGARRLYMTAVQSVVLYGAPVWHDKVVASSKNLQTLRGMQRRLVIRAIRGYRTVAFEAACVLAGVMPWILTAGAYVDMYRIRVARREDPDPEVNGPLPPRAMKRLRLQTRQRKLVEWEEGLSNARTGLRAVEAIRPVLMDWVDRQHGALDFRLVQVLTGHGCFGEYLHRIGRERSAACHHCDALVDTAEHTLAMCPAWEEERSVLRRATGGEEVSLSTMVRAMVDGEDKWKAVASFCGDVMARKEAAEREREADAGAPPSRRRRGGARRRTYDARLL